jgi:hypothetical protein
MDALTPRARLLLALLGLLLIFLSLLALSYALGGPERVREQESAEPTWFVPPPESVKEWGFA